MRRSFLPSIARSVVLLGLVGLCLWSSPASAQISFPRLGFSAAADALVDSVAIESGDTFTLHVSLFGAEPGVPLDQEFSAVSWVVISVCCGATLEIIDIEYNDAFISTGDPYTGVMSVPTDGCIDTDMLNFATLTVTMASPGPGEYFMVAGPFLNATDCDGGHPILMDSPVRVLVSDDTSPNDAHTWGSLKSLYR